MNDTGGNNITPLMSDGNQPQAWRDTVVIIKHWNVFINTEMFSYNEHDSSYMYQWFGSALIQALAGCQRGSKPIHDYRLIKELILLDFFHSKEYIWKSCPVKL